MNLPKTIALFAITLSLQSCHKDPPNTTSSPGVLIDGNTNLVTTKVGRSNYYNYYRYDAQNRLIHSDENRNVQDFSYYTDKVEVNVPHDNSYDSYTLSLNSDGLVKYSVYNTEPDSASYFYNNNGFCVLQIHYISGMVDSIFHVIFGDNIMEERVKSGGYVTTTNYQYDTIIDNRDFGKNFYGKRSKNLVMQSTTSISGNNPSTKITSCEYRLDTLNRVKLQINTSGSGSKDSFTFYYR